MHINSKLRYKKYTQLQLASAFVICILMSIRIPLLMYFAQGIFMLLALYNLKSYNLKKNQMTYVYLSVLFTFLCLLSIFWAASTSKYLDSMKSIIQIYAISIMLYLGINSKEKFEFVSNIFSIAGWAIIGYIVVATPISAWNDMIYGNHSLNSAGGRLGPTIGMHTNMAGSVLAVFLLFGIYQFLTSRKKIYIVQCILLFVCIMFTKSRTSLAICVVGITLFIAIYKRMNVKQFLRILFSVILIVAVLYISMQNDFLYSLYGKRLESLLYFFNDSGTTDASVTGRMLLQEKAFEIFKEHPIFGVGIGNFSYYNDLNSSVAGLYAHNNYLELLADVGIVGCTLYYLPFIICLLRLRKKGRTSSEQSRMLYAVYEVLIIMRLIADYGQVSYLFDSSQILLAVAFAGVDKVNLKSYVGNKE